MALPPPKCGEMEAFYPVLEPMELSAEFGYTTRKMYEDKTMSVEELYKSLHIPRSTFYKYMREYARK
jgi:predicted transcriptional regulator